MMGLFDDLTVDYPLPDPEYQKATFQTKSFDDPYMNHYLIADDGRLLKHRQRQEEIPEAERTHDPLWGGPRTHRWVDDGWDEVPYHGDVVFYENLIGPDHHPLREGGHDGKGWIQYRARFTDGRVVWIRPDTNHSY